MNSNIEIFDTVEEPAPLTDRQRIRVLEAAHVILTTQNAEMVVALQSMQRCLEQGETRMGTFEVQLKETGIVTIEVRDILTVAKAGLRVLGGVGAVVRWMGYIAVAFAAVYTAVYMATHGGNPPGK